jgi:hypothetical protein
MAKGKADGNWEASALPTTSLNKEAPDILKGFTNYTALFFSLGTYLLFNLRRSRSRSRPRGIEGKG